MIDKKHTEEIVNYSFISFQDGGATTPPDWVTAKTRFINDFNKRIQRQEHNNPNYFIEEKPVRKNKARRRK